MRRLVRWRAAPLLMSALALALAAVAWWWLSGRAEPGTVRPNPRAPVRPERQYVLTYWDYRWPTAPDGTAYERWLVEALTEFRRAYPNVRVEYRLLDWGAGDAELRERLRAGNPPDVYAPPPGGPVLYDPRLQVPVDPYLTREERGTREAPSLYLPAAWPLVSRDGRVQAWPRYLTAHVWVANRRLLTAIGVDPERLATDGWDQVAFAEALSRRPAGTAGLLVNPAGAEVLLDLMQAAGTPSPLSAGGAPQWNREAVSTAARWLEGLRNGEHLPSPAGTADAMVERILTGRAALLAGVNPWLLARLTAFGGAPGGDLVLVPVPVPAGNPPALRLSGGHLVVFRQQPYRGDDHTRAAVELARFLSRLRHPWALPGSPVMPAFRPAWEEWVGQATAAGGQLLAHALAWAQPAPALDAASDARLQRYLEETVGPALGEFWAGKLDAVGLSARIGTTQPPPGRPARRPWWWRLLGPPARSG